MNMQFLREYAFRLLAIPYKWGGDDPIEGFDCSGYCKELMMASAIVKRGTPKLSAQQLFDFLMSQGGSQGTYGMGSYAFFGKDVRNIGHVGFTLDPYFMLHYGSGDSSTLSPSIAASQNAFGRMDLILYRKDFLCVVKPAYRIVP